VNARFFKNAPHAYVVRGNHLVIEKTTYYRLS
jgi:hypothetical protein